MILGLMILALNPPQIDAARTRLIEEDVPAAGSEVAAPDDKPKPKKRVIRKRKRTVLAAKPISPMDLSGGPKPYITLTQSQGPVVPVETPPAPPSPLTEISARRAGTAT